MQAVHDLFNNETLRRLFLKLRYVMALALLVLLLAFMRREWLLPAFLVSLFGELIQVWAFASLVKNEELTARGPYVLVRNPMYLGRYFLILGFLLLFGSLWLVIAYTVLYYFYMVNRVQREERRLVRLLGEPYENYRRTTNRFWPHFTRLGDKAVRFFDWQVLIRNNGHWNLLSAMAAYIFLFLYALYFLPGG